MYIKMKLCIKKKPQMYELTHYLGDKQEFNV